MIKYLLQYCSELFEFVYYLIFKLQLIVSTICNILIFVFTVYKHKTGVSFVFSFRINLTR